MSDSPNTPDCCESGCQMSEFYHKQIANAHAAGLKKCASLEGVEADADKYRDALLRIVQWADAYPVDIFVPPTAEDLQKLHHCLVECGLTLDKFSADCMRHVVTGVGNIARNAIAEKP